MKVDHWCTLCYFHFPLIAQSSRIRLTIKLDIEDVAQIKTVLENNGILIEDTFNTTALSYDEKERLDMLMKFIKP